MSTLPTMVFVLFAHPLHRMIAAAIAVIFAIATTWVTDAIFLTDVIFAILVTAAEAMPVCVIVRSYKISSEYG